MNKKQKIGLVVLFAIIQAIQAWGWWDLHSQLRRVNMVSIYPIARDVANNTVPKWFKEHPLETIFGP